MNWICVSVRDRSAEYFFPPFYVRSQVEAIRAFEGIMAQPQRSGARSEYELAIIGVFDDQTGLSVPEPVPRVIARGDDFADKPQAV